MFILTFSLFPSGHPMPAQAERLIVTMWSSDVFMFNNLLPSNASICRSNATVDMLPVAFHSRNTASARSAICGRASSIAKIAKKGPVGQDVWFMGPVLGVDQFPVLRCKYTVAGT